MVVSYSSARASRRGQLTTARRTAQTPADRCGLDWIDAAGHATQPISSAGTVTYSGVSPQRQEDRLLTL